MSLDVSILVVSFNTKEMTIGCLRSVFRETSSCSFEIVVVDNASSDGTAEAIAEEFGSSITLIPSAENLGFARANNLAACEAKGEFVLLLNPDTVVLDGAIDRLLFFARSSPKAGIWGGRTVFSDGSLNPAYCWSRQTLWSLLCQAIGFSSLFRRSPLFNPEGVGSWNSEIERSVDIVSGCFLLIRMDCWRRLNGFRPEFFMYGEEADLCLRARALGAMPMVTSNATIIHYGGASETVRADKLVRLLSAKMRLIRLHFPPITRRIGCWLLFLWPLSRFFAHAILTALRRLPSAERRDVWRKVVRRRNEWYFNG